VRAILPALALVACSGLSLGGCATRGYDVNGVEIREGSARHSLEPDALARRSAAAVGVVTTDIGRGMAFVIDSRGYLVSNRHVIEDADHIEEIVFPALDPPLRFTNVRVVYIDGVRDLALLEVESDRPLPVMPLASRTGRPTDAYISPTDRVMLLSRRAEVPEDALSKTTGLVAHLGEVEDLEVYNPAVGPGPYVAVSPTVRQGQSGGPVVDRYGRAVGVVTWTWKDRPGGFAIPIAHATSMLEERPRLESTAQHRVRVEARAMAFLAAMGDGEFEDARRITSPSHARDVREQTVALLLEGVPPELVQAYVEALEELVLASAQAGSDPFEELRSVIVRAGSKEMAEALGVERKLTPEQVMTFFMEFGQAYISARVFGELEVEGSAEAAIRRLRSLDAARSFALAETVERFGGRALEIERIDVTPGQYAPRAVVTVRPAGATDDAPRFALQMRLEWGDWYVAQVLDRHQASGEAAP
jgi:S1-C subfamily serine protease